MTIENNKKYKLTGEQIKDLASRFGVLSGEIGDLTNLTTTDKTNLVAAINEAAAGGGGPTVVQTTGQSTTDVMSQDATTKLVYPLGESYRDRIGIGLYAHPNSMQAVAVGAGATVQESSGVALGSSAYVGHQYSVALGDDSKTTRIGEVFIGCENNNHGYNNTKLRLIGGVHDPQSDHDAATKGYVDSVAPTITMTTTDPGEGAPLAANQFIGVYQ